jgi:hypothetical protein
MGPPFNAPGLLVGRLFGGVAARRGWSCDEMGFGSHGFDKEVCGDGVRSPVYPIRCARVARFYAAAANAGRRCRGGLPAERV